jgi:hypothetical protein
MPASSLDAFRVGGGIALLLIGLSKLAGGPHRDSAAARTPLGPGVVPRSASCPLACLCWPGREPSAPSSSRPNEARVSVT